MVVRHIVPLVALGLALALPTAASARIGLEASVVRTLRADLDGNGVREQIQVVRNRGANPYGGDAKIDVSYVRVIDSSEGIKRIRQVSPKAERMEVRLVRSYVTDSHPDIWYQGSMGNAGNVYIGLVSWDDGRPDALWRYSAAKSGLGRRWSGARATLVDLTANGAGFEIRLQEGVLARGDPMCCPSKLRISLYRFGESRYTLYRRILRRR